MANKLVSYFRGRSRKTSSDLDADDPRFKRADGLRYVDFFKALHARYLFDWYMEIGCRTGAVFSMARGKTIAVDPYFQVKSNVIGSKPALHVFQTTSDDFFASGFLERNQIRLSFSFIDGMHLFEYLLRDFIHAERNSHPDGVIALHDCCPSNMAMTTRDLQNLPQNRWTGDVWKLMPILQKYRPDLQVDVLNCRGTGLVVVSGLDPKNDALSKNYDEITIAYADVDLEAFGIEAFFASFTFVDAQQFLQSETGVFGKVALPSDQELQLAKITP